MFADSSFTYSFVISFEAPDICFCFNSRLVFSIPKRRLKAAIKLFLSIPDSCLGSYLSQHQLYYSDIPVTVNLVAWSLIFVDGKPLNLCFQLTI